MFFVSNLLSSSQAGRRRFDPGLPLQFSITWEPPSFSPYSVYSFKLTGPPESAAKGIPGKPFTLTFSASVFESPRIRVSTTACFF